ncbi:MAG: tetratricopeptide repeat protein [Pseudanabaenaceae cyanobacterium]
MSERAHWEKVLAADPNSVEALWRLGDLCYGAGEAAQALAYKERALDLDPTVVGAAVHRQLGLSRWQQGQRERAVVDFQRAIAQGDEESRFHLAQVWAELGETERALTAYREILHHDPENLMALLNGGALYLQQRQTAEAIAWYSQAVAAYPDHGEAQGRLGNALLVQGDWEEARLHLELALANAPDYVPAYLDLAASWGQAGDPETAIAYARMALTLAPQNGAAYAHLGNAYLDLNELVAAEHCLRTALALAPDLPEGPGNLAIALLKQGKYTEGWQHYEGRWRSPQLDWPAWATAVWQGEPVQHLLLWAEQGYGDTLQFVRFVPLVRDRVETLTLLAPAALHPVLQGLGVSLTSAPVPHDAALPLMSLPGLLGITLGNLPQPPYLQAAPVSWPGQRRLGLVWASKRDHPTAARRSLPLHLWAPLMTLPNVEWVSLQKEVHPDEASQLTAWGVHQPELADFGVTAAWVAALDLVVTVDTAVAHLAGALGKPVWILVPWAADWRWLTARDDSPWYPSARLFRQPEPGQWEPVIAQVQTALRQPPPAIAPPHPIAIGWQTGQQSGWEVFGANAALHLPHAHLLLPPQGDDRLLSFYGERWARLRRSAADFQQFAAALGDRPLFVAGTVIHPLGNHPTADILERLRGEKNVAFLFAEDSSLTPTEIAALRAFDGVVVGSQWNAEILRAVGVRAPVVWQGIDPSLFHPAPKTGLWGDRFVIFSGGKLEYRKAQDLVLAAFRLFWQKHPEALLVTAWHTRWPQFTAGMDRYTTLPPLVNGTPAIIPWAIANGLPPDAIVDLGPQPHERMAPLLREADVALFPNRAEGGTNLVAMECMACGIPTILSNNTGHQDLIASNHNYVLQQQGPVPVVAPIRSTEGWGESDIEEILTVLETIYGDRPQAQAKGQRGAAWIARYTWAHQMQQLATVLTAISPNNPAPGDRPVYRPFG